MRWTSHFQFVSCSRGLDRRCGHTLLGSFKSADPATGGIAIPQDASVNIESVRLGIFLRQFNLCQQFPVRRIHLVDLTFGGTNAPEDSVLPREAVRPDGWGGNATDNSA